MPDVRSVVLLLNFDDIVGVDKLEEEGALTFDCLPTARRLPRNRGVEPEDLIVL